MFKIIGKFFWCAWILIITYPLEGKITLAVKDMKGNVLTQAAVGVPFQIEVTLKDCGNQIPIIDGYEQFEQIGRSSRCTMINGQMSASYTFTVRALKSGTYNIGPAHILHAKNTFVSNIITLPVQEREVTSSAQSKSSESKQKEVLGELILEPQCPVVGEKCTLRLICYADGHPITVRNIVGNDLDFCIIKNFRETKKGKCSINGKEYEYISWEYDFCPIKTGSFTIPAYAIEYEQQADNHWFGWASLFGRTEMKQVFTNAIQCTVESLPQINGPIHAVGQFQKCTLTVTPHLARETEGLTLKIVLEGSGNVDALTFDPIVPDTFKIYPSEKKIVPSPYDPVMNIITLEYVLQPMQAGEWEIPSQEFVYFDTLSRTIKQLTTTPVSLSVLPGLHAPEHVSNPASSATSTQVQKNDLPFLIVHHIPSENRPYSYWIMMFWMFCLLLVALGIVIWDRREEIYSMRITVYWYRIMAFMMITWRIKQLEKQKNVTHLYYYVQQLWTYRLGYAHATLTLEGMMHDIRARGVPLEMCQAFQIYLEQLATYAFFDTTPMHNPELFKQTYYWLSQLRRYL